MKGAQRSREGLMLAGTRSMRAGDSFVVDLSDGKLDQLCYARVLEAIPSFPADADHVDEAAGAYEVLTFEAHDEPNVNDGVVDFFGWDSLEEDAALRLTVEQTKRAEELGWPARAETWELLLALLAPP